VGGRQGKITEAAAALGWEGGWWMLIPPPQQPLPLLKLAQTPPPLGRVLGVRRVRRRRKRRRRGRKGREATPRTREHYCPPLLPPLAHTTHPPPPPPPPQQGGSRVKPTLPLPPLLPLV